MKMKIRFNFEKNLDLHLMKMQIHFYLRKRSDNMQIFETKKQIITIIKRIKNTFEQNKSTIHDMNI